MDMTREESLKQAEKEGGPEARSNLETKLNKIEQALLDVNEDKNTVVIARPTDEEVKASLESKEELLRTYQIRQEALKQRNKDIAERKRLEAEAIKESARKMAAEKAEAQRLLREEKETYKAACKAEARQKQQTAKALESKLEKTRQDYESSVTRRAVMRPQISKLENAAKEAEEAVERAMEVERRAKEKLNQATDKALAARKRVLEAKSPELDANIDSLKAKLKEEYTQVQEAWKHINPKKRRKELMNNDLRKKVRDLLK